MLIVTPSMLSPLTDRPVPSPPTTWMALYGLSMICPPVWLTVTLVYAKSYASNRMALIGWCQLGFMAPARIR